MRKWPTYDIIRGFVAFKARFPVSFRVLWYRYLLFALIFTTAMKKKHCCFIQVNITCGCLFGLGTRRVSETLDCLIVVLGMSNGHVVFFTERG